MKKLLVLALGVVTAFTFAACESNNNDMTNSNRQADQSRTDSAMTNNTQQAEPSETDSEQVKLPENYDKGVLYTTVTQGNTKELLYASKETIEAMKAGKPFPSGTSLQGWSTI